MLNWFRNLFAARRSEPEHLDRGGMMWIRMSDAGVPVSHDTAMQFSAVWACVRVIAESVAQMGWHVFEHTDRGRQRRPTHPVDSLLDTVPNEEMGAFTFRETLVAHALTWGNGFAEVERDNNNRPVALWPIEPDRVRVVRDASNQLVYLIRNGHNEPTALSSRDVFHLKGLGYDGVVGYSVVEMASRTIGLGLVQEQAGAAFWKNGARPGGILTADGTLTREARQQIEREWNAHYSGGKNVNKTALIPFNMRYQAISIPNEDAQFIESRKFSVEEIARWYRVPPHKIASLERATFSNIESQGIEFVVDTLVPWALRLEQEADAKLISRRNRSRLFTKLNVNSLMRGDSSARAEFYTKLRDLGVFSVNDILELEDLNTIGPVGDIRLVPLNMVPLDQAGMAEAGQEPSSDSPPNESMDPPAVPAQRAAIRDTVVRLAKREANELDRSWNRSTFAGRQDRFYAKHAEYMVGELRPLLDALAETASVPPMDDDTLSDLIAAYCEASQTQAAVVETEEAAGELIAHWTGPRAEQVTDELIEHAMRPLMAGA